MQKVDFPLISCPSFLRLAIFILRRPTGHVKIRTTVPPCPRFFFFRVVYCDLNYKKLCRLKDGQLTCVYRYVRLDRTQTERSKQKRTVPNCATSCKQSHMASVYTMRNQSLSTFRLSLFSCYFCFFIYFPRKETRRFSTRIKTISEKEKRLISDVANEFKLASFDLRTAFSSILFVVFLNNLTIRKVPNFLGCHEGG